MLMFKLMFDVLYILFCVLSVLLCVFVCFLYVFLNLLLSAWYRVISSKSHPSWRAVFTETRLALHSGWDDLHSRPWYVLSPIKVFCSFQNIEIPTPQWAVWYEMTFSQSYVGVVLYLIQKYMYVVSTELDRGVVMLKYGRVSQCWN